MNKSGKRRAFTIVELLVVVSIIALLVGILLPAIGKAREQAHLTRSQANVRQLVTAANSYAAEWQDRQFTVVDDNIASYALGGSMDEAIAAYTDANGTGHPPMILGWDTVDGNSTYWYVNVGGYPGFLWPISFVDHGNNDYGFGYFRFVNLRPFNQYLSGRFYGGEFYAPKDRIALAAIEECVDSPSEFCTTGGGISWSSYCFSPAALFNPDVLSRNRQTDAYYTDPFSMNAGFRSPGMSQARYPDLKTHIIEHHWLQGARADCNPGFSTTPNFSCEPYYFNHSADSIPVCSYFDGHIEMTSVREAMDADSRLMAQSNDGHGLWTRDTPMGTDGYFQEFAYDFIANSSFHILTTDGILGRDKVGR